MKFKEFITEKIISKFDKDTLIVAQEIIDIIEKSNIGTMPVLYRGFSGLRDNFAEITNTRTSFYGGLNDTVTKFIQKYLEVKNPTFATTRTSQAEMFGRVHIFLPQEKDTLIYSSEVQDILTSLGFNDVPDTELEELLKTYTATDHAHRRKHDGEIIVDTKKYYLIDYMGLVKSFNSKFFKPEHTIENMNYNDIVRALKAYISYNNYLIKVGKRKSFEDTKLDNKKQMNRMDDLRAERLTPKNKTIRYNMLLKALEDSNIEYIESNDKDYSVTFKTQGKQKAANKVLQQIVKSQERYARDMNNVDYIWIDNSKDKYKIFSL